MLKKRIIPILNLYKNTLVKSKNFKDYTNVGNLINSIRVYNSQFADEIIILNIDNNIAAKDAFSPHIKNIAKVCFMPLTLGGGVRSFEDISYLIRNGADKVVVSTVLFKNINIIEKAIDYFGSQSIVACIDVKKINNEYSIYINNGKIKQKISLEKIIKFCEDIKIGEIMIQSIDKDGMMNGYDLELIKNVCENTNLPVVAAGGSGNSENLLDLFKETNVSAAACGSLFNFTDTNPIRIKSFLSNYNINFKKI